MTVIQLGLFIEHSSSNKEEAWWKMGKSESDHLQKGGKISEYEKKIETNG